MSAPDIVYVVRAADKNEELRYSLRSLANLPHAKVWIAGYCPSWVQGVGVIPVKSRTHGHQHAKASLRAACEHPEVSDEFVYMNDDFFVMQPLDELPVMHRGTVADMVRNRRMATSYTSSLEKVREPFDEIKQDVTVKTWDGTWTYHPKVVAVPESMMINGPA